MSISFTRKQHLCKQIIILDGLTGTGKTMFAPLINSFERVQNSRFEYMVEYLCISSSKLRITKDATNSLLNLITDIKHYDGLISREVNFRPNDLSSIFSNPNYKQYLKQLIMKDGRDVEKRILNEKPILFFVTHQILSCIQPAFESLKNRLKCIQMVRHPLYLVDHWDSYIMMHGNNARDFTLWINYNGKELPWFAEGWEEKYLLSTSFDRSIYAIAFLMKSVFEEANIAENENKIIFIPFEKFVLNPNQYIQKLEKFLDTKSTSYTNKILKKQNVPRISINDGPQKSIYKRYGLKKNKKGITHADDYLNKLESAKSKSSSDAYALLLDLCKSYENAFGIWF